MSRAVEIVSFLVCLNLGFVVVGSLGIWSDADVPEGVTPSPEVEIPGGRGISGTGITSGVTITLGLILVGVAIGGVAGLASKITTPKVVGIVAFAIIFQVLLAFTITILSSIYVPSALILAITVIHEFALVYAVIEMSTGVPFPQMA